MKAWIGKAKIAVNRNPRHTWTIYLSWLDPTGGSVWQANVSTKRWRIFWHLGGFMTARKNHTGAGWAWSPHFSRTPFGAVWDLLRRDYR